MPCLTCSVFEDSLVKKHHFSPVRLSSIAFEIAIILAEVNAYIPIISINVMSPSLFEMPS